MKGSITIDKELSLRPAVLREDKDFLFELYCSTRQDLMDLSIPDDLKTGLLMMQFNAQSAQYLRDFPDGIDYIIERHQKPVGRLMIDETGPDLIGIDLALLPSIRNHGVGSTIFGYLFQKTKQDFESFIIHVTKINPAKRLYDRLGFEVTGETEMYFEMIWRIPNK